MTRQIMVVDDWLTSRAFLGIILERSGFDVLKVEDSTAALALLGETTPDLFILDLNLPGMDGIELCRRIRARPELAKVPVIIHSARLEELSRQQALEAGANIYLTKPTDDEKILAKVRLLLEMDEEDGESIA